MRIGIYFKKENTDIVDLIKSECVKFGFELDDINPEVVFSVGGDGTFLRAVHKYINQLDEITFIGINSGSLGFLYDFSKEEISSLFKKISEKKLNIKQQPLLKGSAFFKNNKYDVYALNEIRIESPFHTLISDVFIGKEELETFRGNGLVVCSTLGSSAYNKSLGGALIDNDINALELIEVAGIQNNVYRSLGSPLIIKGNKTITFSGKLSHSVVGYDHLNIKEEEELTKVEISYSNKKVNVVYSEDHSYIQKIRKSFVV